MPKQKKFDRGSVLSAASGIFQQKGYNGTSIDELLQVTGLSRSSLYDTFKDKHSLYLESLEYYRTASHNGFDALNGKSLNGLQKIEKLFKDVVNHLTTTPEENGCLMVNATAEMGKRCDKTAKVICEDKEEVKKMFATWLDDAHRDNALQLSKPVSSYGSFLFNALCGLKVMSQSGAGKDELNNVVKVTMEALV
jgi:TetR/AcrR family transcriptional repressor of nem operon